MQSVKHHLKPLKDRIANLVVRGIIQRVKDDGPVQLLQTTRFADDVSDDAVERFGNYGFTSHPHAGDEQGAEAIILHRGGDPASAIVIAVENRRYRLKGLQAGEVAIYTDEGDYIKLARGNQIQIKTKSLVVDAGGTVTTIDGQGVTTAGMVTASKNISTDADLSVKGAAAVTGDVSTEANITATGNIDADGDIAAAGEVADSGGKLSELREAYNSHDHDYTDTPAGPAKTGPPGKTV